MSTSTTSTATRRTRAAAAHPAATPAVTREVVSIASAMRRLNYRSRDTIYTLARRGQLDHIKIGEGQQGRAGITIESIEAFLAKRQVRRAS